MLSLLTNLSASPCPVLGSFWDQFQVAAPLVSAVKVSLVSAMNRSRRLPVHKFVQAGSIDMLWPPPVPSLLFAFLMDETHSHPVLRLSVGHSDGTTTSTSCSRAIKALCCSARWKRRVEEKFPLDIIAC